MPRQLPIVGQKPAPPPGTVAAPDDPDERPPWHWAGIGAVLIFTAWLPLALVSGWLTRMLLDVLVPAAGRADVVAFRAGAPTSTQVGVRAAMVGPAALAFALASAGGGALVGRFGGRAGPREGAVAGWLAASTAWALTAAASGLGSTWALWFPVAGLGTLAAWLGARAGLRAR
jgi:tRNA-(ms[2]io[6]A)-hydroxylase